MVNFMKKLTKIINITALSISVISILGIILLLIIFSSTPKVKVNVNTMTVDGVSLRKRTANEITTYYGENINGTIKYFIVLAFDIFDLDHKPVYLTIKNSDKSYLIVINSNEQATVTY